MAGVEREREREGEGPGSRRVFNDNFSYLLVAHAVQSLRVNRPI